ncbi:MAG: condensation domain-containing protein [Acidobacteriota bacterium]|nr:condensation domain-containing protein [Acidobacteriota bacterium]
MKLSDKKRNLLEKLLQQEGITAGPGKGIQALPREGAPPVSAGQYRLWLLEQLYPGRPTYNLASCLELEGPLDIHALSRAINEMMARHEILRTIIVGNTEPRQQIVPSIKWKTDVVHLDHLSREDAVTHAYQESEMLAGRPFDIAVGPLFRIKLFRISGHHHVLFFVFHHIIFDGWSNRIYFAELSELYDHFATGKPVPPPEPSIQYADFAQWQRNKLKEQEMQAQRAFWLRQMAKAPPALEIPADLSARATSPASGRSLMTLGPELTGRIESFRLRHGTSSFMILLAVFQILLERFSGQEDICLCSPMACRNQLDTEKILGLFNNIVFLRTDLSGNPSGKELLERVKQTTMEAGQHATLPFQEIGSLPCLARFPLSRAMFVVQESPRTAFKLSGLSVKILDLHNGCHNFDFSLIIEEREKKNLGIFLDYRTACLSAGGADALLADYRQILESFLADPNRRLHDFPTPSINRAVDADVVESARNGNAALAPHNEQERRMLELWKEILNVDHVGITDNFFSLAGNSLQALRLWERLGLTADGKIPIATLVTAPTIEQLCRVIQEKDPGKYGLANNNHPRSSL